MGFSKLYAFIKPYRGLCIVSALSLLIFTGLGIPLPWFLKVIIDHCLEELHLLDFSEQMKRTAMLSFEGQSLDEKASIIVNFLVSGGVHGSEKIQEISYLLNHNPKSSYSYQKVRSLIRRCFPPLAMMQDQYTRLCDAPWLLPFYWGVRAGRIFFRENERIKIMRTYQTRKEYQKLKTVYRAAGIIKD